MKSNELRIGNYLLISNHDALVKVPSSPQKVSGIISKNELEFEANHGRNNFKVSTAHCYGISLNEDWLKRFGFSIILHRECKYRAVLGDFELCCNDMEECYNFMTLKNQHGDNEVKVELMFVHQLQNLYYFLTGNELELKN